MGVKNRDRLSIVADILEVASLGSSKTRIMFGANLSFSLLEKYLGLVMTAGFVEAQDSKYRLTESGREFLKRYRQFRERYSNAQRALDTLGSERERLANLCQSCASGGSGG